MAVWIYVLDTFKPIDVDVGEVLRLAEDNPIELFNRHVKDVVERELGGIDGVELHDVYFNPEEFELLVEYIVRRDSGEASVKIIYSKDPISTLTRYYRYEERKIRRAA
jgi:hypothetical protein